MKRFHEICVAACALLPLLMAGCHQDSQIRACETLPTLTEDERLLLIECIPIGSSYQLTKDVVPALSELRDEGGSAILGGYGLKEAKAVVAILGRTGELEANYRDGSLYAIGYWLYDLPAAEADSLSAYLIGFYAGYYGAGQSDYEPDGAHEYVGHYWCPVGLGVVVGNNRYAGRSSILAWGFQDVCPGILPAAEPQPRPAPGGQDRALKDRRSSRARLAGSTLDATGVEYELHEEMPVVADLYSCLRMLQVHSTWRP